MPDEPIRNMCASSLHERVAVPDDPAVREYGLLLALLLASAILSTLAIHANVPRFVNRLGGRQLIGATVYTIVGLVVLTTAVVAVDRLRGDGDSLDGFGLAQFVGGLAVVLFVATYALHGAVSLPVSLHDIVDSLLTGGLAMALPAVVYARMRGVDLRLALPDEAARPLPLVVAEAALLVALAHAVTYGYLEGLGSVPAGIDSGLLQLTAGTLLLTVVFPGVVVGVGLAILYHGVFYERLRSRLDPVVAVAAVTTLAGDGSWGPLANWYLLGEGPTRLGDGLALVGASVVGVVLTAFAAIVAAGAAAALARSVDLATDLRVAAAVGVAVAVGPVVLLTAVGLFEATAALAGASFAVLAAVATVGYEKTQSVWVPALAFAIYQIVTNIHVTAALARFVG